VVAQPIKKTSKEARRKKTLVRIVIKIILFSDYWQETVREVEILSSFVVSSR